jgi:hypothetical protein
VQRVIVVLGKTAGPCDIALLVPDSDANNNQSVVQEIFSYPETLNQMLGIV